MCHWCKLLTHQIWLSLGKKRFWTPTPHGTPKSHPWGMTQATEWKSRLICFISFNCEKTNKVWLKNLWNWLCDWDLMIFDLLDPPQGPRGWGPNNCAVACAIDVSYSHTNSGWISNKKLDHSTPHGTPKSDPWGMTQAREWKSRLICFISFICEKTHKVWFKNLWNWLCNWNWMIFNNIWPFCPSLRPQGAGQKKCAVAHHFHVSNSHTKFGWISSNGLGRDSVTDRRTDGQTDGRTDGGDCNIPDAWG